MIRKGKLKMLNDYKLDEYAKSYAKEILEEVSNHGGDEYDLAHEFVDSSPWVIYYHKAHQICQNCNIENGEQYYEDCGPWEDLTYNGIASIIAYGELHARVCQAIDTMKEGE
tara:strand:- start:132 stop:467 length:336 start_codon:yes stop_codon:yes gene_type:complete